MLADLISYLTLEISFAGNLFDRIIFWIWLVFTFYIVFKFFKNGWIKAYGFLLIILTFLSLVPMGILFFTITAFAIDSEKSIKVDDEIRLVETTKSVIARPQVSVVKNYWIFEKVVGKTDFEFEINEKYYRIGDAINIKRLTNVSNKKITIEFEFENGTIIKEI